MDFLLKHKKIIIFIALVLVGFLVYVNSFQNEFFWDDDDSIVNNVYIKNWKHFDKYFTENLIAGSGQITNYYRPVLLISFAVDYYLWKLNPFGFHLTNTLLHIFCAYLIFLILHKLILFYQGQKSVFKIKEIEYSLPFLVSLFFLIHPLQTEAITYVAGRADPLSSLLSLLAIWFYVQFRLYKDKKIGQYILVLIFFILALLTKEQVILLPFLILLIEAVFFLKKKKKSILNAVYLNLPLFLISGIYFLIRLFILNFDNLLHGFEYAQNYDAILYHRLLTFSSVALGYLKLLFLPFHLHMAREVFLITSIFNWQVLFFLVLIILVILICIKTWKKNKLISFGVLWFAIILLPRTNIFQINRPMYEHWLYLPMLGFYLSLFCLLILIWQKIKNFKLKKILKYIALSLLIIYIIGFSVLTILRNNDWKNPIVFYEKNLKYTPNSFIQHNNLGMAYADAGYFKKSIIEYRRAIEIKDVYAQVHYNLANSLDKAGKTAEAIQEYKIAIKMSPSFSYPYNNLLVIYLREGMQEEAEELLKQMKIMFD